MSLASAELDYEQAGELKIGQAGIANLRIRVLDVARLVEEMRQRVVRAPKLFGRAAVILDFGGLAATPDAATAQALIDGLRAAGVLPVALAYGTGDTERLSEQLGLPLLAKFRAQYERAEPAPPPRRSEPAPPPPPAPAGRPGRILRQVRSGQQVYAEQADLTVLGMVSAGAEILADGSIHVYGSLRGRALAGAGGNLDARIFCREFQGELVAIAGRYKVLDDMPRELRGKAVQIWLEDEQIKIAALD